MKCKNCGDEIQNSPNYCPNCGAKVIKNRLNPKVLAYQVNQEILAIDNRLFRTVYALFVAPQDVIIGYISGVRKKYQDVLQFFAIALTIFGFHYFIMKIFFPEVFIPNYSWLGDLANDSSIKNNPILNMDADESYNYSVFVYVVALPISAVTSFITYWMFDDRRFNLTEHFVINLYITAQIIIVNSIITTLLLTCGLDYWIIQSFIFIPLYTYFIYVLKCVFNEAWIASFAKFLMIMFLSLIIVLILSLIHI